MSGLADALRLTGVRWHDALRPTSPAWVLVPMGAWLVLAWSRFGALAISSPRALVRFILTGVYGWLGLAVGMWLIAFVVRKTAQDDIADMPPPSVFVRIAGYAHLPLLAAAFGIAFIAGFFGISGFGLWFGLACVAAWMPAMLATGTDFAAQTGLRFGALIAGVPQLIWLLTIGLWLSARLSHLL